MYYDIKAHVLFGASAIQMKYDYVQNLDCMSNYKLVEWKGAFGVRPIVCCEAWTMIHSQAECMNITITHFYWALYWMRTYQTEVQCARNLRTNPKTLREKYKAVLLLLSRNIHRVVSNKNEIISIQFQMCYHNTNLYAFVILILILI